MRIIIDTIKSKIETDNITLLEALQKLYSFYTPGYYYTPAYRSFGKNGKKKWDGKKYFITKNGYFKTGLLKELLDKLKLVGCIPEIIDKRIFPEEKYNDYTIKGLSYYSEQKEFIELALKNKRGIIQAPTGSGKSLIIAGLVKALQKDNRRIVILVNAKLLLKQIYNFLIYFGIKNVGINYGDEYIYGDIMISTVQSISNILDTHLNETEVLIVDEIHEFCFGDVTLAAIESFPKANYRFGFTATVPEDKIKKYNLIGAFGPIWQIKSTANLISEGKLTIPKIHIITMKHDPVELLFYEDCSYPRIYERFIIEDKQRTDIILDKVNKICKENKKARILIITKSLDHLHKLTDLIKGAYKLEGEDSLEKRYEVIHNFLNKDESSILIGTKILQTGINIEEITHFINARGAKSRESVIQALGRALRKHESKKEVIIYDFLDDAKYLKEHSKQRIKYYKKEGHEIIYED